MPSTFDPLLRLELQATGENQNTWGTKTNNNLELLAEAIAGHVSVAVAGSGNYTLTTSNAATDEARYAFITLSGTLTGNRTIIIPSSAKTYVFRNNTTGAFTITIKTATGTGITLPTSGLGIVVCDGTETYTISSNEFLARNGGGDVNGIVSISASTSVANAAALAVRNSSPTGVDISASVIAANVLGRPQALTSVAIYAGTSVAAATSGGASRIIVESATVSASVSALTVRSGVGIYAGGLNPVQLVSDTFAGTWNSSAPIILPGNPAVSLAAAPKQYVDTGDRWVEIASVVPTAGASTLDITWTAGAYRAVKVIVANNLISANSEFNLRVYRGGSLVSGANDYWTGVTWWWSNTANSFTVLATAIALTTAGTEATLPISSEFIITDGTLGTERLRLTGMSTWTLTNPGLFFGRAMLGGEVIGGTGALSGIRFLLTGTYSATGRVIVLGLKS